MGEMEVQQILPAPSVGSHPWKILLQQQQINVFIPEAVDFRISFTGECGEGHLTPPWLLLLSKH